MGMNVQCERGILRFWLSNQQEQNDRQQPTEWSVLLDLSGAFKN